MLRPVHLARDFLQLLSLFDTAANYFTNDFLPDPNQNYQAWAEYIRSVIYSAGDLFYVRNQEHKITGAIWVNNWLYYNETPFACELSALSARGQLVSDNLASLQEFTQLLFKQTPVYIVRSIIDTHNISARRALKRAGYTHPETQRAAYLKNNCEHTTIIYSMTRPEFENRFDKGY